VCRKVAQIYRPDLQKESELDKAVGAAILASDAAHFGTEVHLNNFRA
jgi:hypothetical protein